MAARTASRSASEFLRYRAYGVAIRSELQLPLPELRGPAERALFEVTIRASSKPLSCAIPEGVELRRSPLSEFDFGLFPDGSSYVRWDDIGEALISQDGRSIACRPFRQADSEPFHVYLLGQALSFALVKSGFEPLHGTAVVVENQAVAFLGDCGFGKSTLAAAFLQAGYRLLTDDVLLLRTTTRGILVYAGPARIKLFPEMARELLGESSSGVPLNPVTQKLIIPLGNCRSCADAAPLATIFVLAPPGEVAGRDIRIAPISQRQAFVMLVASAFNYAITDPDRLQRHFKATQALANMKIVRRLSYPRSLECLPLVREVILSDLRANKSEIAACKD